MRTATLPPPAGPPRRPDDSAEQPTSSEASVAPGVPEALGASVASGAAGVPGAGLRARVSARLPRWTSPVVVAVLALVGCVTLALVDPARRGELSPGCPFRTLTGWDCPGCGGTRAVYALTQGQWLRAIDHNVLVVALLPVLAWAWVGWLSSARERRPQAPVLSPRVTYGLVGVVAAFWVARNLPGLEWLGSLATWSLGA